ncbi:hypothetical protein AGMMS50230_13490 [Spirochaetia bacterium]|nr:hypothetical protein AGMMS50230_13490 [Spirochaetia bacterium]
MTKKYGALLVCFFVSLFVFAMDWPVREGRLIANFGSNDAGIPLLGNSFAAAGPVYAADVGKLIFVRDPEHPSSQLPSPLGSWLAVDHGDNMVGIYSRYEENHSAQIPTMVEKSTVLASAGSSGWAKQSGLYFAIFDRRERRWVNPQVLIAGIEDTTPPVIRQVELRSTGGTPYNPAVIQRIPQGLYSVFVDASDIISGGESLTPNRISCSINGAEAGTLSFETLVSRQGKRMVYRNGIKDAAGVYDPRGFGLGEIRLNRGQAAMVIEASDMAGNSRSVTYRLTID